MRLGFNFSFSSSRKRAIKGRNKANTTYSTDATFDDQSQIEIFKISLPASVDLLKIFLQGVRSIFRLLARSRTEIEYSGKEAAQCSLCKMRLIKSWLT